MYGIFTLESDKNATNEYCGREYVRSKSIFSRLYKSLRNFISASASTRTSCRRQ